MSVEDNCGNIQLDAVGEWDSNDGQLTKAASKGRTARKYDEENEVSQSIEASRIAANDP